MLQNQARRRRVTVVACENRKAATLAIPQIGNQSHLEERGQSLRIAITNQLEKLF